MHLENILKTQNTLSGSKRLGGFLDYSYCKYGKYSECIDSFENDRTYNYNGIDMD